VTCVLLTGATGFLGMELLARLLEREDTSVIALVRAADREQARERLGEVLARLYDQPPELDGRLLALPADVAVDGLGLAAADRRTIRASTTAVAHCAASISFDLEADAAFNVNALGTARMLDLAASCNRLERFVHVSTAYVAGDTRGTFGEDDLERDQGFRNTYEWSKFGGERLVEQAAGALPTVVARPSIVVGDRRSGWTPVFNVIYWPLRAFARGLLTRLPVDPDGIIDVVPVDYVADALVHLLENPEIGGRLHVVAGEHAVTAAELTALACAWFERPAPQLEPGAGLPDIDEARLYRPYFDVASRFDDRRARSCLAPAGIVASPIAEYFPALMGYAERARWGKRGLTREAARAQPCTADSGAP
jgi:thioester reductase-like protein